ncbi:MAG TPA: hypothetical protein VFV34_09115 [Blastocatellia bacterium]|nr:hypothetical protein [Blastocatellia bacterium]
MRSNTLISAGLVLLSVGVALAAPPEPPRRIRFEPGAISAQVRGRVTRQQAEAIFILRVRSGQHSNSYGAFLLGVVVR